MKEKINIAFLSLLMLVFTACSKELGEKGDDVVTFGIVPTIIEAGSGDIGSVDTRAKLNSFDSGLMIGLGINAPGASPALSSFYNHFYGLANGTIWFYYLNNVNSGDKLSGFSHWGNINLYGYYPYNASVTDLAQIPFHIATVDGVTGKATGTDADAFTDHMVAGTATKNMGTGGSTDISLRFGHLMTALELIVTRTHANVPALKLGSVIFEIGGNREFIVSGKYTAVNPTMSVPGTGDNIKEIGNVAKEMTIFYPTATYMTSTSKYATVNTQLLVLMPELKHNSTTGFENATVKLTFHFLDQDDKPYIFEGISGGNPSISFDLKDVSNSNTTDLGLLAGYTYAVTATMGTYTHFAAPTTGTALPPQVIYGDLVEATGSQIDI